MPAAVAAAAEDDVWLPGAAAEGGADEALL